MIVLNATSNVRLFEHAAEHERLYRLMLAGAGLKRFQQLLRESIVEFAATQRPNSAQAEQGRSIPLRLHAQFMAGGTLSVLAWWLEEGQPFSPRQMAAYLVQPHWA
jgi:hypothetical protein